MKRGGGGGARSGAECGEEGVMELLLRNQTLAPWAKRGALEEAGKATDCLKRP